MIGDYLNPKEVAGKIGSHIQMKEESAKTPKLNVDMEPIDSARKPGLPKKSPFNYTNYTSLKPGETKYHSDTKNGMYHILRTPENKYGVIFKPKGTISPERMTVDFNSPLDANSAILRHDKELSDLR